MQTYVIALQAGTPLQTVELFAVEGASKQAALRRLSVAKDKMVDLVQSRLPDADHMELSVVGTSVQFIRTLKQVSKEFIK